jgi:SAM-dependent methyltransferase
LYHLHSHEDKVKALSEAKRVTKTGGVILAAYYMNDYCVIKHGFMEGHIKESVEARVLTGDFQCLDAANELYSMVRLEEINALKEEVGLTRIQIIAADGAADYIRPALNAMDEESFELFLKYHWANCERPELLGASSHTVDILQK